MTATPNHDPDGPRSPYDVSAAIDLLEPGKPLVLFDGLVVTDSGHLIISQYVDIAPDTTSAQALRPCALVKAIEQRHALEFSSTVQISSPHRFREFGESGIQDDQEGRATVESATRQEGSGRSDPNLEQQEALRRLHDNPDISLGETVTWDRDVDSKTLTFGRGTWIYCTSAQPTEDRRESWRASLPDAYDHESVIRQPSRFALALASAFADQHGPRARRWISTTPWIAARSSPSTPAS